MPNLMRLFLFENIIHERQERYNSWKPIPENSGQRPCCQRDICPYKDAGFGLDAGYGKRDNASSVEVLVAILYEVGCVLKQKRPCQTTGAFLKKGKAMMRPAFYSLATGRQAGSKSEAGSFVSRWLSTPFGVIMKISWFSPSGQLSKTSQTPSGENFADRLGTQL